MQRNRIFFKVGVLLSVLVTGFSMFIVMQAESTVTPAGAADGGMLTWLVLGTAILIAVVLGVMMVVVANQRAALGTGEKRKHEDMEAGTDPYLDALADDGMVLGDDGELPEWIDAMSEKPKRS
ncbi:MAG: hypothetical protein JXN59_12255 [Anaerolineae bacterium]|nr:hypothetical protein [Anaerolineae bacterium]